ncbi:MAG: glycohydrolase toxin TNT-related protein, partial [Prevotellaceae bacterium]|nr:glycohydrolase toxin TNT-related protein [Prevotellaceae bacterium]
DPLPEGWTIKSGKAAPWGQQPGGATQLQVIKDNGKAASITDLLEKGILKGKESPVGLHG